MKRKRLNAGTVPANKEYAAGTVPANKEYAAGTVPANKEYAAGTLLNVRAGWLAMRLGAGILCWVLACCTIDEKEKTYLFYLQVSRGKHPFLTLLLPKNHNIHFRNPTSLLSVLLKT